MNNKKFRLQNKNGVDVFGYAITITRSYDYRYGSEVFGCLRVDDLKIGESTQLCYGVCGGKALGYYLLIRES